MNLKAFDYSVKEKVIILKINVENIKALPLPKNYSFVYFKNNKEDWIDLGLRAKMFKDYEDGLFKYNKYYKNHEDILSERVVFIKDELNNKLVGTAAAYFDIHTSINNGKFHWLFIDENYRGKGLAKPLISFVLNRLHELGYNEVLISTETKVPLACKLYLEFGAKPYNIEDKEAYEILDKQLDGYLSKNKLI